MSESTLQKRLVSHLINHKYAIVCQNNTDMPDVVAKKNEKAYFFEVKGKLFDSDKTIGQCLRCIANTKVSGFSVKSSKYFHIGTEKMAELCEIEPIEEAGLVVPVDTTTPYLKKLYAMQKIITSFNLPIKLIIGTGEGLEKALPMLKPTNIKIKTTRNDENYLVYKAAKVDEWIKRGFKQPNIYREQLNRKLPYLPLLPEIVVSKDMKPFEESAVSSKMRRF